MGRPLFLGVPSCPEPPGAPRGGTGAELGHCQWDTLTLLLDNVECRVGHATAPHDLAHLLPTRHVQWVLLRVTVRLRVGGRLWARVRLMGLVPWVLDEPTHAGRGGHAAPRHQSSAAVRMGRTHRHDKADSAHAWPHIAGHAPMLQVACGAPHGTRYVRHVRGWYASNDVRTVAHQLPCAPGTYGTQEAGTEAPGCTCQHRRFTVRVRQHHGSVAP